MADVPDDLAASATLLGPLAGVVSVLGQAGTVHELGGDGPQSRSQRTGSSGAAQTVTCRTGRAGARSPSETSGTSSSSAGRRRFVGTGQPSPSRLGAAECFHDQRRTSLHSRPPLPQPSGGIAMESICRSRMNSRKLARPAWMSLSLRGEPVSNARVGAHIQRRVVRAVPANQRPPEGVCEVSRSRRDHDAATSVGDPHLRRSVTCHRLIPMVAGRQQRLRHPGHGPAMRRTCSAQASREDSRTRSA